MSYSRDKGVEPALNSVRMWDGKEWERHCLAILRLHYGAHELHEVPDRHGGDLGLEAFSTDGCAYQCYAALEPVSTNDLFESQRDKLTEDCGKLKKNAVKIGRMFGTLQIRRYMFMVHRHDSVNLVRHGREKAVEVRSWALPFVANDFDIVVITDDAYSVERAQLLKLPPSLVDVAVDSPDSTVEWSTDNPGLVSTATRKLSVLPVNHAVRASYVNALVRQYLDGENALSKIRDKYPDQWQMAVRCKISKENLLVLEHADSMETPSVGAIGKIASDLATELMATVPSLGQPMARMLSWATVAEWLMRCPLDFTTQVEPL